MIKDRKNTKYLQIGKEIIPVWIYGDLRNPLILFIHGWPLAFSQYRGDLPIKYLKKNYCIISFDLPYFGYSSKLTTDPIEFIKHIVDRFAKKRKYFLFGSSLGSSLALAYARYDSSRVKGVIVSGLPIYPEQIAIIFSCLSKIARGRVRIVLRQLAFLRLKNLRSLRVPVLLLYGKKDTLATPKMGKKLTKLLRYAKLAVEDNRTHGWLLHRIDKNSFYDELIKFLKIQA